MDDYDDDIQSVDWSDLPKELCTMIGKCFNSNIDLLRFRSTCNSWRRSSVLPSPSPSVLPSISLPPTFNPKIDVLPSLSLPPTFNPKIDTFSGPHQLTPTAIYRIEPSDLSKSLSSSSSSSSSSSKSYLIKVEESSYGRLRLLDPFTNNRLLHFRTRYPAPSDSYPKVLDLLKFRFVELIKTYSIIVNDSGLRLSSLPRNGLAVKVVGFPDFGWNQVQNCRFFSVNREGKLGFSKIGDDNEWTLVDDKNFFYDDIIVYKGQLYVVDRWGTISWIDSSSLRLVQFSPPLFGLGKKKHLVESCGSLYVVDMYTEGDPNNPKGTYYEVVNLKVYRLDEEWGRWLDVKSLGEYVFVLSKDCNLSLLAKDYHGCEEDCIYFCCRGCASMFNLKTSTFGTSPSVFWPCPTLFNL